jgi:hypothetical protein
MFKEPIRQIGSDQTRGISRCGGVQALGLYLLLVTVADSQGLSYYSDKTAARLLGLNEVDLRQARHNLVHAGLIAYQAPLYQVLSLEPTSSSEPEAPRSGKTLPFNVSVVLRHRKFQREPSNQKPRRSKCSADDFPIRSAAARSSKSLQYRRTASTCLHICLNPRHEQHRRHPRMEALTGAFCTIAAKC